MRCVLQRVASASVEVEGEVVSSIGPGILCLVGIATDDTSKDAEWVARKLLRSRVFPSEDESKPWDRDVTQLGGDVLLVSQFTLHARFKKPKPDFSKAMGPGAARDLYSNFVGLVGSMYDPARVRDGRFGAMMKVALVNDGPVTFTFDSRAPDTSGGSSSSLASAGGGGNGGGE
ncbi:MAG: D-Tyr tRNAtyr deacylase-like domain-containing protein [Monoraphidium minutum]|nr:MAG: D-Tyr tRNAtyr deacylase-like domain-containing protein [Monoraphidium minutum]